MEQQTAIPYGYCHCGCGQKVSVATHTSTKEGYRKGEPVHFLVGHRTRLRDQKGHKHHNWKGGKIIDGQGYVRIKLRGYPRENQQGYVFEHLLIVEKVLEKPLPPQAEVHHFNGEKADNSRGNLIVCQDRAYHMLLHTRMRAMQACGNPNFRPCAFCKHYDDPANMHLGGNGKSYSHLECGSEYNRQRYIKRKLHNISPNN